MNSPNQHTNYQEFDTEDPAHIPKSRSTLDPSAYDVPKPCKVRMVDQEIDCHCHSYQFWYVVLLVLYVTNFVSAIFVMGKYFTSDTIIAPKWLYIVYAIMALIIVIIYVLMEIETWEIHNGTLYLYSGLLAFLNALMLKALITSDEEGVAKRIILGIISGMSCLTAFWIVPKLRYRAKNLIRLEQKRRSVVKSEQNI